MIRLLQEREPETVNKEDFYEQLSLYAHSHYRMTEDGKRLNWLDENMDPETGVWLAREILRDGDGSRKRKEGMREARITTIPRSVIW